MTTETTAHSTAHGVESIAASPFLAVTAPLAVGLVLVGGLIWAVRLGRRVRRREPGPPLPEDQPRLPEEGPVREVREQRVPDEVPRGRGRLTPHRLKGHGNSGTKRG
ncbi:DUF6479 family protein [Actinomycetota bacterium Odt1-20B]